MTKHTHWIAIINPNSGKGNGQKHWHQISEALLQHKIDFESIFTEGREHAIELATTCIAKGERNFIVIGGDGTLNEVVNAIMQQKYCPSAGIAIAMIAVGTGNDWGRTYGIPQNYHEAAAIISAGNTCLQDAGLVTYFSGNNMLDRYFINMAGMGFDALVAKKTNKQKEEGRSNPLGYFYNIFTSLFYQHSIPSSIIVDENEFRAEVYSASAGICKYNGGGMMQAPNAIPDDGLLDLTIITSISRLKVIMNARKLFDGTYISLPEVTTFRGEKISIKAESPIYLETDGESLGHSPFEFSVIPKALKVVIPKGE